MPQKETTPDNPVPREVVKGADQISDKLNKLDEHLKRILTKLDKRRRLGGSSWQPVCEDIIIEEMGATSRSAKNIPAYKQRRFYVLMFLAIVTTIILSLITDVFDLRSRAFESIQIISNTGE